MIRFCIALLAIAMMGQNSFAQLFPNARWNQGTTIDADGCTVDVATGRKLSCPLARRNTAPAPAPTAVVETFVEPTPQPSYVLSSYAAPSAPVVIRSGGSSGGSTPASYGSSGGGGVGSRDAQGHVITSIGSTVSPTISATGTQAIQPLAIGDRIKFRRALLAAARQARESGEITAIQFFMLSAASRNPNVLDKMQAAVHEAAIEEGLATAQAIDWDALISFIEKLIPIIIQLIDLFS